MEKIRDYIKRKKIPLQYFVEETGYTKPHISSVLNGKKNPSHAFLKLFTIALKKHISCDENTLKELKESLWNSSFPS